MENPVVWFEVMGQDPDKLRQILVSSRLAGAVEHLVETEEVGSLTLKGLLKPVPALNVVALKPE